MSEKPKDQHDEELLRNGWDPEDWSKIGTQPIED